MRGLLSHKDNTLLLRTNWHDSKVFKYFSFHFFALFWVNGLLIRNKLKEDHHETIIMILCKCDKADFYVFDRMRSSR